MKNRVPEITAARNESRCQVGEGAQLWGVPQCPKDSDWALPHSWFCMSWPTVKLMTGHILACLHQRHEFGNYEIRNKMNTGM